MLHLLLDTRLCMCILFCTLQEKSIKRLRLDSNQGMTIRFQFKEEVFWKNKSASMVRRFRRRHIVIVGSKVSVDSQRRSIHSAAENYGLSRVRRYFDSYSQTVGTS